MRGIMTDPYLAEFYKRVTKLIQGTHGCSIRFTAAAFADLLAQDDPDFDRERFFRNCGLGAASSCPMCNP